MQAAAQLPLLLYSEGLIRLNVVGRDGAGQVAPEDYESTCEALKEVLLAVRDARSGKPMVKEILRPRRTPFDPTDSGPPADLVIMWQEDEITDTVDSPHVGRIGPLPYFRSGGHYSQGFVLAQGPEIQPGGNLPEMQAQDLTATLLSSLGQPLPAYLHGHIILG